YLTSLAALLFFLGIYYLNNKIKFGIGTLTYLVSVIFLNLKIDPVFLSLTVILGLVLGTLVFYDHISKIDKVKKKL
ncbi:hypothetical protein BVX95_01270, partial [archaeon D22]